MATDGSIKYLGKGRRNPYGVYPPVTEFALNGSPVTPKALCYVDDWMIGFAVLTAYKAGTYTDGMENNLKVFQTDDNADVNNLAQKILADYNRIKNITPDKKGKTFAEIYEDFYKYKFEQDKSKKFSESAKNSMRAAFKNCSAIHDCEFRSLRHDDLQKVIDECKLGHASLELIKNLFKQMYAYGEIYELCEKDYSAHVKIKIADDDEHGVPFSDLECKKLWEYKNNPVIEMILIMCYSGYRIAAYQTMHVDLNQKTFQGGVKTSAGKDRIVPIHSAIFPLVCHRIKQYGTLMSCNTNRFRNDMYKALETIGIAKHTPHDCRHTFSALCEKYKVNENDRKRMLGHSFGNDITNQIYGHRDIEDLRIEIEKIKVP